MTRLVPQGGLRLVQRPGSDSVSPGPQGEISASPIPWESDLLPDKSNGPRVGLEPLQPLRHGGAQPGARLGRVLMRLAVASGHCGKLTSLIMLIGQHYAANSLPKHRPMSVNWHQLTGAVLPAPRMASVRGPFDHSVRSDGMEDKNDA